MSVDPSPPISRTWSLPSPVIFDLSSLPSLFVYRVSALRFQDRPFHSVTVISHRLYWNRSYSLCLQGSPMGILCSSCLLWGFTIKTFIWSYASDPTTLLVCTGFRLSYGPLSGLGDRKRGKPPPPVYQGVPEPDSSSLWTVLRTRIYF